MRVAFNEENAANLRQYTANLNCVALVRDFIPEVPAILKDLWSAFTKIVQDLERQLDQSSGLPFENLTRIFQLLDLQLAFATAVHVGDQLSTVVGTSEDVVAQIERNKTRVLTTIQDQWTEAASEFAEVYSKLSPEKPQELGGQTAKLEALIAVLQVRNQHYYHKMLTMFAGNQGVGHGQLPQRKAQYRAAFNCQQFASQSAVTQRRDHNSHRPLSLRCCGEPPSRSSYFVHSTLQS